MDTTIFDPFVSQLPEFYLYIDPVSDSSCFASLVAYEDHCIVQVRGHDLVVEAADRHAAVIALHLLVTQVMEHQEVTL